jgi:hypothetical protein
MKKTRLNRITKELKRLLNNLENDSMQNLKNLSATNATNYSLWKATKRLKQLQASIPPIKLNEGGWARNEQEKALAFGKHLGKVFQPFAATCTAEEDNAIHDFFRSPISTGFAYKEKQNK